MSSEWLPETVIRRRLWSLAKFNRTDIEIALLVRGLISSLITAYVKNWHDGKPLTDSKGVPIIEWPELLKFVCRLRPDIWPPLPDNCAIAQNKQGFESTNSQVPRKPGPLPIKTEQAMRAMLDDVAANRATINSLNEMKREALAKTYGVSRGTAVRALLEIMSRSSELTLANSDTN